MNIFFLDKDPKIAARKILWRRHIVKMPIESAQMLSTACNLSLGKQDLLYDISHKNHPCSKWVRLSSENYSWLIEHSLEICKIYTELYKKVHNSQAIIEICASLKNNIKFRHEKLIPMPQCVPRQYYKNTTVEAYIAYYLGEKVPKITSAWLNEDALKYWDMPLCFNR